MPQALLTRFQADLIAEAIAAAVDERARFLEDDVRPALAQVLRELGKEREADLIEPS